jgi:hypothetical protein
MDLIEESKKRCECGASAAALLLFVVDGVTIRRPVCERMLENSKSDPGMTVVRFHHRLMCQSSSDSSRSYARSNCTRYAIHRIMRHGEPFFVCDKCAEVWESLGEKLEPIG